jgi:hypothetical protein
MIYVLGQQTYIIELEIVKIKKQNSRGRLEMFGYLLRNGTKSMYIPNILDMDYISTVNEIHLSGVQYCDETAVMIAWITCCGRATFLRLYYIILLS